MVCGVTKRGKRAVDPGTVMVRAGWARGSPGQLRAGAVRAQRTSHVAAVPACPLPSPRVFVAACPAVCHQAAAWVCAAAAAGTLICAAASAAAAAVPLAGDDQHGAADRAGSTRGGGRLPRAAAATAAAAGAGGGQHGGGRLTLPGAPVGGAQPAGCQPSAGRGQLPFLVTANRIGMGSGEAGSRCFQNNGRQFGLTVQLYSVKTRYRHVLSCGPLPGQPRPPQFWGTGTMMSVVVRGMFDPAWK